MFFLGLGPGWVLRCGVKRGCRLKVEGSSLDEEGEGGVWVPGKLSSEGGLIRSDGWEE